MKRYFSILLLFCSVPIWGQDTLPFSTYQVAVLNYHPLIKQAQLANKRGDANMLRAKGNFDPKLEAGASSKFYNDKNYFNLQGVQLKVPTPFAVEFKGAYDRNDGTYLDPSLSTGNQGLVALGLQVPLWQGLVFDERRAAKRLADTFLDYSDQERRMLTNDLLLSAYGLYWNWWANFEKKKLALEIWQFTSDRMDNIRFRAEVGQAATYDTLEASIQVGARLQQLQEAETQEIKARFLLSTMLWINGAEQDSAVYISPLFAPESPNSQVEISKLIMTNFIQWQDSVNLFHPELMQYQFKMDMLNTEIKWKKEKTKPKINLNYNALAEPLGDGNEGTFSTQNYKWGVDFAFPLFARDARGDLQLSRIKQEELGYQLQQKTQEIRNKAWTSYQTMDLLKQQTVIAAQNVDGYMALLLGERIKFDNGESSLFLLNMREIQYLESRQKWIDLQLKQVLLMYEIAYFTGKIAEL